MKDTILSIIRHAVTLLGGYLLAKGAIGDAIAAWLPGALCILIGGIWGAVDEYKATRQVKHLVLSLVRHALTAAGGCLSALGKIGPDTVEQVIGAALAVIASLWGVGDEYVYAQEKKPEDLKT
jgi:hypothetical protein